MKTFINLRFNFFSLKRFAVISLVPLLLFHTIGYYLVFYGDLLGAKHEAAVFIWGHESLGDKMVTLTFPLAEGKPVATGLVFTDDDEFMYQGRMYDVASSTKQKGRIIYKCYTDNKETALNDGLCNTINSDSESPAQNHKNNSVLKEFVKDYILHKQEAIYTSPVITGSCFYIRNTHIQSSIFRLVASPPPEFIRS